MKKPMIDTMMMEKYDTLFTPEEAIAPLLSHLDEFKGKRVWECCDRGGSNITKVLRENGFDVVISDIVTGIDFLRDPAPFNFDLIVTNPPYSLKNQFLARCYEYNKPFSLLLPLTTLEGQVRGKMFREKGISVIVPDRRFDFTGKGANWFATGWFVYQIMSDCSLSFEPMNQTA